MSLPWGGGTIAEESELLRSYAEQRSQAALAAVRERRDRFEHGLRASATDFEAAQSFGALNRTMKEAECTFAVFDQLPMGDARRRTLAGRLLAFDDSAETRQVLRSQLARAGPPNLAVNPIR